MQWRIKWRFSDASPRVHASEPFETRAIAIANACPILAHRPYEIWIEGPLSERIEAAEVARICRQYGAADQVPEQDRAGSRQPDEKHQETARPFYRAKAREFAEPAAAAPAEDVKESGLLPPDSTALERGRK